MAKTITRPSYLLLLVVGVVILEILATLVILAHLQISAEFSRNNRWQEAKESYQRSLELHEDNAEAWLGMGRVSLAMEDASAAERYYNR